MFQLLSLINILYRFPKDNVPASSLSIPSLFTELDHHLFDSLVGENHVVQLINQELLQKLNFIILERRPLRIHLEKKLEIN